MPEELVGGVEAGGTKVVCAVGEPGGRIVERRQIATGEPAPTLATIAAFFGEQARAGRPITRLGVASFGPLELRPGHPHYGSITATPKPGWSNVDLAGTLAAAVGVPVIVDTDVNGAALAEARLGAGRGLASLVYLTLGTGIGGGVLGGGRLLRGLGHPEIGHVCVPRAPGDRYPGCCPFHGDCLEGLACGPALAARFGRSAGELAPVEAARAAELVAWYVGAGLRTVVYVLAPERIVVGGGLAALPGLLALLRTRLRAELDGYPGMPEHEDDQFLVPAGLGENAGVIGSLLLASQAP